MARSYGVNGTTALGDKAMGVKVPQKSCLSCFYRTREESESVADLELQGITTCLVGRYKNHPVPMDYICGDYMYRWGKTAARAGRILWRLSDVEQAKWWYEHKESYQPTGE